MRVQVREKVPGRRLSRVLTFNYTSESELKALLKDSRFKTKKWKLWSVMM